MGNETKVINFRVDEKLYNDFINLCNIHNKNMSEMLRHLLQIAADENKINEAKDSLINEIHKTIKQTINAQLASVRGLIAKTYHSAESASSISAETLAIITKRDVQQIVERAERNAVFKLTKGGEKN